MPCGRQCAFSSSRWWLSPSSRRHRSAPRRAFRAGSTPRRRSEEHTSELQSQSNLVCRLLLEKKKLRHVAEREGVRDPRLGRLALARRSLLARGPESRPLLWGIVPLEDEDVLGCLGAVRHALA